MVRAAVKGLASLALVVAVLVSCKTIGVREIYTSLDEDGTRRRTVFYTDTKALYCVAEIANGRIDATVEIKFIVIQRYDYGQKKFVSGDNLLIGISEAKPAAGGDSLKISTKLGKGRTLGGQEAEDNGPFPAGQYACEVAIDGELQDRAVFNIIFPENGCPLLPAVATTQCIGFVQEGANCPGVLPNGNRTNCTCLAAGTWQCDNK